MSEPAIDLSEIIGPYKEDARRSVAQMRAALQRWDEVVSGGAARLELRKLAHQLRGSGRTYGFREVSRLGKALERLMVMLQEKRLPGDERMKKSVAGYIERLAVVFK